MTDQVEKARRFLDAAPWRAAAAPAQPVGRGARPSSWPRSASRPWPRPAAGSRRPSGRLDGHGRPATRPWPTRPRSSQADRRAGVRRPRERLRRRPGRRGRDGAAGRRRPAWPGARSRTSPADADDPIYDAGLAVERVAAAAEAAHRGPVRLVLTARAENHLHGRPDLADTIARLQAYQEAGADVLYAPGLTAPRRHPLGRRVGRPARQRARPPGRPVGGRAGRGRGAPASRSAARSPSPPCGALVEAARELRDDGHLRLLGPGRHRGQGRRLGLHLRVGCGRGPRGPAWRGRRWGPGRAGSRRR